ncbi:MAG: class I SAM-dependent methyltransferase [Cocleimonas sp.]
MQLKIVEKEQMEVASLVSVSEYITIVRGIIDRGGPEVSEYEILKEFAKVVSKSSLKDQLVAFELMKPLLVQDSMLGFTFQKPHGYAGDFELINRIYIKWKSDNLQFYKWDILYHALEATEAVRNRVDYFKGLARLTAKKHDSALVLNLGSGPCIDLFGYLRTERSHKLKFECLDMDQKAIDFGTVVCDNYLDDIKFIKKNALKFDPGYQYDLIWSAGLFDYFNDKIFTRLLRRVYAMLKPSGELVIGNFSTYNPSREIMELLGQWYLYHRSKETLFKLAVKAGIPKHLIEVEQEDMGINLFLHLRKI